MTKITLPRRLIEDAIHDYLANAPADDPREWWAEIIADHLRAKGIDVEIDESDPALDAVREMPDPAADAAELACPFSDGEHTWELTEAGYIRTWSTVIDTDDDGDITRITAAYTGSEDFSDDGDGDMHLSCSMCVARRELPDHPTVEYV